MVFVGFNFVRNRNAPKSMKGRFLMQLAGEILIARRASPQGPQKKEGEKKRREEKKRRRGEEKIMLTLGMHAWL